MTPWAAWKAACERGWTPDPPRALVRLAVTCVPDETRCSIDGETWGVMRTESELRRHATNPARHFFPKDEPASRGLPVGRYSMYEYVFVDLEWYNAMLNLGPRV